MNKIEDVLPAMKIEYAHIVVGLHTHNGFEPLGGSYDVDNIISRFGNCVIKKTHILSRSMHIVVECAPTTASLSQKTCLRK